MQYLIDIVRLIGIIAGAALFSVVGLGIIVLIGHVCHGDEPRAFEYVKQQINRRFYGYPVL